MKRRITTLVSAMLMLLFASQLSAQLPQAFNYQAVARNSSGTLLANQNVGIEINIRQTSATGTIVYTETFSPTTNQFGLFTIAIGTGTPTFGTFNTIAWNTGDYWLQVEMDPTGGTSYVSMGASQLLSVPYAMYSSSAGTVTGGAAGSTGDIQFNNGGAFAASTNLFWDNTLNYLGVNTTSPAEALDVEGGNIHLQSNTNPLIGFYNGTNYQSFIQAWGSDFYFGNELASGNDILWANGAERMRVTSAGLVGIGTTTPDGQLTVVGNGTTLSAAAAHINNSNAGGIGLYVNVASTDVAAAFVNSNTTGNALLAKFFDGGNDIIRFDNYDGEHEGRISVFGTNSNTAGGYINGDPTYGIVMGDVTSTGTYTELVNAYHPTTTTTAFVPWLSNITSCGSSTYLWTAVWATNGAIQTSDETKKENIKPISYGLNEIMNLNPVSFQWKEKSARLGTGTNMGFLAQDLEKVLPDVVVHETISQQEIDNAKKQKGIDITNADTYGVKYSEIIPVLVKAIQEQQAEIENLKAEIKASQK
jgi:hypothetical protein